MQLPRIQPLAPKGIANAFDHPEWLFELKHDGFRALAYVDRGKVELVSRTGHVYRAFADLVAGIATALPKTRVVLDGEIVCLDDEGRSQFYGLRRRNASASFYAFDAAWLNGRDLRDRPLFDRKAILEKLLPSIGKDILVAQYLVGTGIGLFQAVCERDCEGIVAKWAPSPYGELRGKSPWLKVLNPNYSQREGRHELFEKRRTA